MFSPVGMDLPRGWPGRIEDDRVVQLAAQTLQAFFTGGGAAREHAEYPLAEVELRAPVLNPQTVRIFSAFRSDSVRFEFGNTASIYGPEDEIPFPDGAVTLDYGVGLAAAIGAEGAIGGYTIANLWWTPDLDGPKRRDFALSIGPVVETERSVWAIRGSVAGDGVVSETVPYEPDWDAVVEYAARNTELRAGDLIVLDYGPGGAELERGEVVELEAEGIGVLRNRVAT
jgi:2-keto-4-pentenoate hydratase/2-oxohepta-3-ene-1,7-dioic acid hydratase in catechol pathway